MPKESKPFNVCTDTCVLINFVHVSRLDLLGQMGDMVFHVPREVAEEISEPIQAKKLEAAINGGTIRELKIMDVAELETMAGYVEKFGKGESACLAVATQRDWIIATDETKDRRLSREIAARGIKVINTPGILLKSIRQGMLSVEAADVTKAELETKRFKMSFASFRDLV
jgi:predicted nucleic acid-binding protein